MTSGNIFFFSPTHSPTDYVSVVCMCLEFSVSQLAVCLCAYIVACAHVHMHVNFQLCLLHICMLSCVCARVFSRLHKHYVLLSHSSSAESPKRQQEIRQAWSPITTTL